MKLTNRDKWLIYSELAKMVKAGFGFDRSTEVLKEQAGSPAQRRFAQALQKGLKKGETLTDALAQVPFGITDLEINVVRAAEQSGSLDEGFAYLHDYFRSVHETERQIQTRLIYPFVLLHLAVLLPVLPKLVLGTDLPSIARQLGTNFAFLYMGAALLWLLMSLLRHQARTDLMADRFLATLPLVGRARKLISWQRFCSVFGMYVRSGQKISDGLSAAGNATQSAMVNRASQRLAEVARSGNPVGAALMKQRAFPNELSRSLQNAETTGTLDEDLRRWSSYYEDAVENQMEKVGTLVPRFIYMIVVVFVGWQIISSYSEYLGGIEDMLEEFNL